MAPDQETPPPPDSTAKTNPPPERAKCFAAFAPEKNGLSTRAFSLIIILSTGFGIRHSPVAPGTRGAALGVGIYHILSLLGASDITLPLACGCLFFAGVSLSSIAERGLGEKDSPRIIIDEIASFPLTMLFISPSLTRIAIAFALNRAADILKPFPAGRIQKLRSGWSIMLDDTVAAIYANLLLRLLILLLKI